MIEHFPDPYPDELLYSVWARYSDQVRYPTRQDVLKELFGRITRPIVDLPCHLGYLISNLPTGHSYTLDRLIDCHTLFPFYSPFLPLERSKSIRAQMISSDGTAIHRRKGTTSNFSLSRLRYCPICAMEERKRLGECYWHRLHQVAGVVICPIHMVYLENSEVRVPSPSNAFISAECMLETSNPRSVKSSPWREIFLVIATSARYLLDHSLPSDSSFLQKQYHALLAQHGFLTVKGHLRTVDLLKSFSDYYPSEVLTLLHCEIKQYSSFQKLWLSKLIMRVENVQHPLYHILMIHFLGSTLERFFHHDMKVSQLFGNGPWPCLNPACELYRELCISSVKVDENTYGGRPIGIFSCKCGFVYSRVGPDPLSNDIFTKLAVRSYGWVWETKLRALWFDQTVTLKAISGYLGVSVPVVKNYAKKLSLPFPRNGLQNQSGSSYRHSGTKDLSWYRDQWLAICEASPEKSVTALRRGARAIYSWLYNHDRDWLMTHRPLPIERGKRRGPTPQIDYIFQAAKKASLLEEENHRDEYVAQSIRSVAHQLMITPGRPSRITMTIICQRIPQVKKLLRHPEQVPLTVQALQEVLETHDAFCVRRLWLEVEEYQEKGICPTRGQLIMKANLDYKRDIPTVRQALDWDIEFMSLL